MTQPQKPQPDGGHLDELIKVFNQSSLGGARRQGLIRQLEEQTDAKAVGGAPNVDKLQNPAQEVETQSGE